MDEPGIEPGTSRMLSERHNQLDHTPFLTHIVIFLAFSFKYLLSNIPYILSNAWQMLSKHF